MTVIVTTEDLRKSRFCVTGTRRWMEHYGLDMKVFLREGLPSELFEKTGDAQGLRLVEIAKKRVQNEPQ
jgi:hypothetical protein